MTNQSRCVFANRHHFCRIPFMRWTQRNVTAKCHSILWSFMYYIFIPSTNWDTDFDVCM